MAKKTVADVEEDAEKAADDARVTLEALIVKRPIEAIIASVLIGVVLGRLLL